ncbi:MAG TPA: hypothetical protein PKW33_07595 [Anaerolineaceae bacterium]|nr:hypothetical protein [Anaerolineaceae bacterium]HPN51435.1 hypothetical protein [Anaerolineaceae bacterium]
MIVSSIGEPGPATTMASPQPAVTATEPGPAMTPTTTRAPVPLATLRPTATLQPTLTRTITPSPTLAPFDDTGTLKDMEIVLWHTLSGPAARELEALVLAFNRLDRYGLKLRLEAAPDLLTWKADRQVTPTAPWQLMLGSVPAPDLVLAPRTVLDELGGLKDLNALKAHPNLGLAQSAGDGQHLDLFYSAPAVFYNRTWAKQLGFLEPPADLSALREQACAGNQALKRDDTTKNDAQGGWMLQADGLTLLALSESMSADLTNAASATRPLFEMLKEMQVGNCLWQAPAYRPAQSGAEALLQRQALLANGRVEDALVYEDMARILKSKDEWLMLPYPDFPVEAISLSILPGLSERELGAWVVARWLAQPEQAGRLALAGGSLPATKTELTLRDELRLNHPQRAEALNWPLPETPLKEPFWPDLGLLLQDAAGRVLKPENAPDRIPVIVDLLWKEISALLSSQP